MSTETIWNPRPATLSYAHEAMKTGHRWRRGGKFWIVSEIYTLGNYPSSAHIILTEIIFLSSKKPRPSGIVQVIMP